MNSNPTHPSGSEEVTRLRRQLQREKASRHEAESIMEQSTRELYRRQQRLELLQEAAMAANECDEIQTVLQRVIQAVCKITGWTVGHAYLVDHGKNNPLIPTKIWWMKDERLHQEFREVTERTLFPSGMGLPGKVLQSGKPQWIINLAQDVNFPRAHAVKDFKLVSGFGFPILNGKQTVGVLEFFTEQEQEPDNELMDLMKYVGTQLGYAFERQHTREHLIQAFEELKESQAQLVHSEKMAGLGQLAAGVAHEINNPISFVMSNLGTMGTYMEIIQKILTLYDELEMILRNNEADKEDKVRSWFERLAHLKQEKRYDRIIRDIDPLIRESRDGIQRVKEIVQGLKSFARLDEAEEKKSDINECLESTLKVIWNELKYKCEIQKKFGQLPMILCHPGQLNQVFMNLLLNAAQAIEENGTITIETELKDDQILIHISDTGKGILPENMNKLFNPFFTTKPIGSGTGLGLSISYGIIQKHKGTIQVHSVPNQGSTFTVLLPVIQPHEQKSNIAVRG